MKTNLLHRGGLNLEVRDNITSEYARLQSLDVTTDVGFRCDKVTVVHRTMRLLVSVWHDNLSSVCFHLPMVR